MFNSAAQKLFGFAHPSEKGMKLAELLLDNTSRQSLLRRHRAVIQSGKQSNIHNTHLITNRFDGVADIYFTPLSTETGHGVIVMFQVDRNNKSAHKNNNPGKSSQKTSGTKTKKKKSAGKRR